MEGACHLWTREDIGEIEAEEESDDGALIQILNDLAEQFSATSIIVLYKAHFDFLDF